MPIIEGNTTPTAAIIDGDTVATAAVIDAGAFAAVDFNLTELVDEHVTDPGNPGSQETDDDILFDASTGVTVETHSHLLASANEVFEFASLDTGIATVAADGETHWVSNGVARIIAKGTYLWKHKNVSVSLAVGQSTNVFNSYVAGSFAKFCTDSIDNAIAGKNMATHGGMFTSMNHAGSSYVRNTASWTHAAGIDCTGISVWNNAYGGSYTRKHGTALHERIAILAAHDPILVGTTLRFVTTGNVVVDRVVDALTTVSGTDAMLARFSEALPGTIGIVKVLPSTWPGYLPHIPNNTGVVGYRIPVFATDQEKKALVCDFSGVALNAAIATPENATRLLFWEDAIGGDSGAPQCLVAGTQLVMLQSWSSTCLPYSTNTAEIDSAMDALLEGAATSKIDLSSYTDFS